MPRHFLRFFKWKWNNNFSTYPETESWKKVINHICSKQYSKYFLYSEKWVNEWNEMKIELDMRQSWLAVIWLDLKVSKILLISDGQPMCRGTLVCRFFEKYQEPYCGCGFGHDLLTRCATAQKRMTTLIYSKKIEISKIFLKIWKYFEMTRN